MDAINDPVRRQRLMSAATILTDNSSKSLLPLFPVVTVNLRDQTTTNTIILKATRGNYAAKCEFQ